jgi:hypothetical protein
VNQLSAKNDYDVAITESFKSPKSWIPGQKVEKLVSAVNTGSVDAFVRMSITNSLDLTTLSSTTKNPFQGTGNKDKPGEVNSDVLNYVTLGTSDGNDPVIDAKTGSASYEADEVKSLQAGGVLAGAWTYNSSSKQWEEIKKNNVSIVGTQGTEFTPPGAGLYIFRRSLDGEIITDTDGVETSDRSYEYVGYYYSKSTGKYYALGNIATSKINDNKEKVSLFDADGYFIEKPDVTYQITETNTVTPILEYVPAEAADSEKNTPATPAYIKATYDPDYEKWLGTDAAKYEAVKPENDIIINIKLSDYADGLNPDSANSSDNTVADLWTRIADTNPTFYYNKLVEAGATSKDLIDSITLDSSVTTDAYYSFDYNLAILLDSVQVTDKDGKQSNDAVVSEWTEVTSTLTWDADDNTKISTITWTAAETKTVDSAEGTD